MELPAGRLDPPARPTPFDYREHRPPRELEPWLVCLWERRSEPDAPVRILPDGCVDIVWTEGMGARIVGANTTAFLVSLPAGTRVVGARLRPGAAGSLLGVDGVAVRDARVPLEQLWGSEGARLVEALDSHTSPVAGLCAGLLARTARAERPDPLVGAAVARLARPTVAVSALAGELGVSERHLHRRVTTAVGYGPKRLARVFRLARALEAGRAGDGLARAALDAGYADQAHFANECRSLAGVPPSVVLAG